jgi:hypothetical protein
MKRRNGLLKVFVLLLVSSLVVGLFTGCSSDSNHTPQPASVNEAPVKESFPLSVDDSDWEVEEEATISDWDFEEDEFFSESVAVSVSDGNMGPIPILLASETGRQLIYSTDIIIETTEFMKDMRLLLNTIDTVGGYSERTTVNGRSLRTPHIERDAFVTLRLPPENLVEFIIFIEDNYQLVFLDKRMTDLTTSHQGNLDHLEDLKEREERLLAELNDDLATTEQGDLERDLENIRADIRNLEATTDQLIYHVALSDIRISLSEVIFPKEKEPVPSQTFGERFQEVTKDSLDRLLAMLQGLLVVFITLIPWLLPITIITFIALYVSKKMKRKKMDSINTTNHQTDSNSVTLKEPSSGIEADKEDSINP